MRLTHLRRNGNVMSEIDKKEKLKELELKEHELKLERIRKNHDFDMARLKLLHEKFQLQKEIESEKWKAIKQMMSPILAIAGPEIRASLKKVGKESGKVASFTCPKCEAQLTVPIPPKIEIGEIDEEVLIKCPKCETITPAKFDKSIFKPIANVENDLEERVTMLEAKITELMIALRDFIKKFGF